MRLVALLALLFAAPAVAKGQPQPIALNDTGSSASLQCVLDGQGTYPDPDPSGWVRNPTCGTDKCAWNDQDRRMRMSTGYVEGTWTDETCLFADFDSDGFGNYPKSVYVSVTAPDDSLRVELANDAGDSWVLGPPVPDGNRVRWLFCVEDPVADRVNVRNSMDPALYWPEVPFSNGGYAQRVEYFLRLTALSRRTRDVTAFFEVAGSGPTWAAPRAITDCP